MVNALTLALLGYKNHKKIIWTELLLLHLNFLVIMLPSTFSIFLFTLKRPPQPVYGCNYVIAWLNSLNDTSKRVKNHYEKLCLNVLLINYFLDLLVSQPVQEQPKTKKKKKRRKPDSYETFNGKVGNFMLILFRFPSMWLLQNFLFEFDCQVKIKWHKSYQSFAINLWKNDSNRKKKQKKQKNKKTWQY